MLLREIWGPGKEKGLWRTNISFLLLQGPPQHWCETISAQQWAPNSSSALWRVDIFQSHMLFQSGEHIFCWCSKCTTCLFDPIYPQSMSEGCCSCNVTEARSISQQWFHMLPSHFPAVRRTSRSARLKRWQEQTLSSEITTSPGDFGYIINTKWTLILWKVSDVNPLGTLN